MNQTSDRHPVLSDERKAWIALAISIVVSAALFAYSIYTHGIK